MTVPNRSNSVPKLMLPVYQKIVGLIDDVCDQHLNREYRALARANDWRVVQEAPEPTGFWSTANVGVRYPIRARENQFSWRPILFSAHEDRGTMCRFRSR